jgi:5'-nucleotidase
MIKRRNFIQHIGIGGILLQMGKFPIHALMDDDNITKITILHTNDVHSRIDPFPMDGSKNQGLGGAAKRAGLINSIRTVEKNVLLFDCGDIMQGTPYFNFFGGEVEFKLMSQMKYDAGTMGNHDFDGGIEGFDKQLVNANFPILVGNYNFDDTVLAGKIKPYKIFIKDGVKIGVFGLGIELDGLVPKTMYKETKYIDPISTANNIASTLKHDEKCDYIICLSHLGYKYKEAKISDVILAEKTKNINMILGGHTHTFLEKPTVVPNQDNEAVTVNQAGWGGMVLGQIDLFFEKNKPGKCLSCKNLLIK